MDKRSHPGPSKDELRMNMASLQRIDPFICNIVTAASQVINLFFLFLANMSTL